MHTVTGHGRHNWQLLALLHGALVMRRAVNAPAGAPAVRGHRPGGCPCRPGSGPTAGLPAGASLHGRRVRVSPGWPPLGASQSAHHVLHNGLCLQYLPGRLLRQHRHQLLWEGVWSRGEGGWMLIGSCLRGAGASSAPRGGEGAGRGGPLRAYLPHASSAGARRTHRLASRPSQPPRNQHHT